RRCRRPLCRRLRRGTDAKTRGSQTVPHASRADRRRRVCRAREITAVLHRSQIAPQARRAPVVMTHPCPPERTERRGRSTRQKYKKTAATFGVAAVRKMVGATGFEPVTPTV